MVPFSFASQTMLSPAGLHSNGFAILTPDGAQAVADFADRRERFHAIKNPRQNVLCSLSYCCQFLQRVFGGSCIATSPQRAQTLDLILFGGGVHAQGFNLRLSFTFELVYADDDRVLCLDRALIIISRVLNLALSIS